MSQLDWISANNGWAADLLRTFRHWLEDTYRETFLKQQVLHQKNQRHSVPAVERFMF